MRTACLLLCVLALLPPARAAGHDLYACMSESKDYVVGSPLPLSGLWRRTDGGWRHLGLNHPRLRAVAADPADPRVLFLAAGNGCIRTVGGASGWHILTGWDMTEFMSITLDPRAPGHIFTGLPDGVGVSLDGGRTWAHRNSGLRRTFTAAVAVDRDRAGRILAGTERGIYVSTDDGGHWRLAGAGDAQITSLAQSPRAGTDWLATTQEGGAWRSRDGGETWRRVPGISSDHTLYSCDFDPTDGRRLVLGGWHYGVLVSADGGATWQARTAGLPSDRIWRVAFDPDHPGRLYASVHEQAVYVSDDAGRSWRRDGLDGSIVWDFAFTPRP